MAKRRLIVATEIDPRKITDTYSRTHLRPVMTQKHRFPAKKRCQYSPPPPPPIKLPWDSASPPTESIRTGERSYVSLNHGAPLARSARGSSAISTFERNHEIHISLSKTFEHGTRFMMKCKYDLRKKAEFSWICEGEQKCANDLNLNQICAGD